MFTTFFLQDLLKKELEEIFKEDRFKDKNGEMVKLNIFKQFLPVQDTKYTGESQEELESSLSDMDNVDETSFPYIIVLFTDGKHNTRNKKGKVNVILCVGIIDKDEKRDGYEWVLHIIQKIGERFQKNFCLGNYLCGEEIQWELSGLDEHPFYLGAIGMEFETRKIEKEDKYC